MQRNSKLRFPLIVFLALIVAVPTLKVFSTRASTKLVAGQNSEQSLSRKRSVAKVPELTRYSTKLERVSASEKLNMVVAFKVRDEEGLRRLIGQLYDPGSPLFHKWITPEEFGERFGQPKKEFERAVGWLKSQGFNIEQEWPNRIAITFSGTVEAIERAFLVQMYYYRDEVNNRIFYSNQEPPQLPPDLEIMTDSLIGLNDAYLYHTGSRFKELPKDVQYSLGEAIRSKKSSIRPEGSFSGLPTFIAPKDFATAYNITPEENAGIRGQGQRVGIIIGSDVLDSDIAAHRNLFNLPPANVQRLLPPAVVNPGPHSGADAELEADLDVQAISSIAPQAEIDLVLVPSLTSINLFNAEQFVVNTAKIPIVNESLGGCEDIFFSGSEQIVFLQAVAQGIAFFAASGDEGAECFGGTPGRAEIECPACYDGVTAVGGTQIDGQFDTNSNLTGISLESVWNEPPGIGVDCNGKPNRNGGGASGGGVSQIIGKPDYQISASGFAGGVPDGIHRFIPDISILGGPPATLVFFGGRAGLVEGTSLSSPIWAGLMALVNQAKGSVQGSPNREIYRLGTNQYKNNGPAVFRDITVGDNSDGSRQPCAPSGTQGVKAGVGYDSVTGWGVPNFDMFVKNYMASPPKTDNIPPTVHIIAPNGGETVNVGTTFNISWTATDNVGVVNQIIDLSTDGGITFDTPITTGLAGDAMSFSVTLTGFAAKHARIQITAIDAAGNIGQDASKNDFVVVNPDAPEFTSATVMTTANKFKLSLTIQAKNGNANSLFIQLLDSASNEIGDVNQNLSQFKGKNSFSLKLKLKAPPDLISRTHILKLFVIDDAGNVGDPVLLSVR